MSAEVLTKDLRDRRSPVVVISTALAILTITMMAVGSGLESTIGDITENMPEALTAFIPSGGPGGYVVGELFNLIAPYALVGYAVVSGAAAIAGEERSGTMSMLSAQPVTRHAILTSKLLGLLSAMIVPIVALGVAALIATELFDIGLTATNVAATCTHLLLLSMLFGTLALAIGAATGNPAIASGVAGGLAAISYVANAMLPLADLDGLARVSPWHYYAGSEPLANGFDITHLLVLAALTLVAVAAAYPALNRRDLKG